MLEEDSYPRGGKRPSHNAVDLKSKKQDNLFSVNATSNVEKKKRKKTKTQQSNCTTDEEYHSMTAEVLSYKTIKEGMLVLGCIKNITSLLLNVELPGRVFGKLQVNFISDAFTQQLTERLGNNALNENTEFYSLSNIFVEGQFIPTKILQVQEDEKGPNVLLSTKPTDINGNYNHTSFKCGMLVWAAVIEKSDHGYILDVGVRNTRNILPFKNVNQEKLYVIGEPLWCIVKTVTVSREASTITMSALKSDLNGHTEMEDFTLDLIIPGMCVDFTVERAVKDGLEGKIFGECLGYVNEIYLKEPLDLREKYVGEIHRAYVLYVQPTTRFTYLSLRGLQTAEAPKLAIGDILSAEVTAKTGKGFILKLKQDQKGLVTYRRILKSLKLSASSDLQEMVRNKYPVGSSHKCRILDYMHMDKLYICTFELNVLREKVFTHSDLKVGELVKGRIEEINKSGLVVRVGNVQGFVTNEHLSNVRFSENIKGRFRVGQMVTARVWINKGLFNIKLTLKQALLESEIILTNYDEAIVNSQYPGVVVKISDAGALIKFYGEVQGWLKQTGNGDQYSFQQLLYLGQVVKATILNKEGTRLTLTLDPPKAKVLKQKRKQLQLGEVVKGKITRITDDGITVLVKSKKVKCFVPAAQLCSDHSLAKVMLGLYRKGNEMQSLICISNKPEQILSVCEYDFYVKDKDNYVIPDQVHEGDLIRCSVNKFDNKKLSLSSPVRQFHGDITVPRQKIVENFDDDLKLVQYQPIVARVSDVLSEKNIVKASSLLNEVFDFSLDYSVKRFERYLEDLNAIQKKLAEQKNPLGDFKLGERVICKVKNISDKGCSVVLHNGAQGLVNIKQCPKNLKRGATLTGAVLWINYVYNYVELSLKSTTIDQINPVQDGAVANPTYRSFFGEILIIHKDFVLCLLGGDANKQLAFIPTHLHENDFAPNYEYYGEAGRNIKFKISLITNGRVIGFEKTFKRVMDMKFKSLMPKTKSEERETNLKRKSERSEEPVCKKIKLKTTTTNNAKMNGKAAGKTREDLNEGTNIASEEESEHASTKGPNNDGAKQKIGKPTKIDNNAETGYMNAIKKKENHNTVESDGDLEEKRKESKSLKAQLPGVHNFFDSDEESEVAESSEEENEQDDSSSKNKKKKFTPADHAQMVREQEEYLRKKEEEFANPTRVPQNAEQFDRRLLGEPNSSELWTQYVAHHVQATEIDKARAVIQRALKTIQQTAIQDRLNVWISYLNLENMYGTKDSFNEVFEEAVRCNDALTIYLTAIDILATSLDTKDLDEKIKKARAKFKQESEVYIAIGRLFYKQGRFVDARKLKDSALRTILDKKKHIPLIVQFAIMELNDGEENQGEALFETIIQSDPRRVDVWSTYVDQLVKKGKVDLARRVLERAVGQKLNYKKMKGLYKKFQDFEQKHGTPETREHVRQLLEEYVSQCVDK